jgi:hypothetical protein
MTMVKHWFALQSLENEVDFCPEILHDCINVQHNLHSTTNYEFLGFTWFVVFWPITSVFMGL